MDAKQALNYLKILSKYNVYVNGSLAHVKSDEIADLIARQQAVCDAAKALLKTHICGDLKVSNAENDLKDALKRLEDKS